MAQLQHHLEQRQRRDQRQDLRDPLTRGDRGSGLFSTVLGLAVLVAVLTLAANVLVDLVWRARVEDVTAAALAEVAESGARDDELPSVSAAAVARARERLGSSGGSAELRFRWTGDHVHLEVTAPSFTLLRATGLGAVERRQSARRELPG